MIKITNSRKKILLIYWNSLEALMDAGNTPMEEELVRFLTFAHQTLRKMDFFATQNVKLAMLVMDQSAGNNAQQDSKITEPSVSSQGHMEEAQVQLERRMTARNIWVSGIKSAKLVSITLAAVSALQTV